MCPQACAPRFCRNLGWAFGTVCSAAWSSRGLPRIRSDVTDQAAPAGQQYHAEWSLSTSARTLALGAGRSCRSTRSNGRGTYTTEQDNAWG